MACRWILLSSCFLLLFNANLIVGEEDTLADDSDVKADEENDVLILTKDIFDEVVASKETILVEFYAPWCGHCKQLTPEYEKAAKRLKEADHPVALAKVDATVETELASRFDVSGYPTLKFFKNGRPFDYDGPRNENGIVEYMTERSNPDWKAPPEAVVVLTSDNFTAVTEREDLMVVMFYAPWCGHCKKMMPDFEKAAQELKKSSEGPIILAKVDATVEKELGSTYDVTGYPTLKIFRKGKASNYKSDAREKYGIIQYIESLRGSASKETKVSEIPKQVSTSDDNAILIVGFFSSDKDKAFLTYEEATNELRGDYQFVHTFEMDAAAQKYKVVPGSVVAFISLRFQSPDEPAFHSFHIKDDTRASDVVSFLESHNTPLVGQFGRKTKDKVYKTKRPLVLFFYTVDWTFEHRDATQAWRRKFAKIASAFPDMTFAIADEEENSDLLKEFSFDESSEEINIGIIDSKERKYAMKPMEEYEADEVVSFLNKFKKGNLKPKIKSQPVPKKSSGGVTVVVGSTFEKIVLDKTKDVLIELYAPWCGHCKKLEPTYKDLAKRFKKSKNLVIAKMDATANDSPDPYTSSGYPTIYFSPAGNKESPISYSGDRSLKSLVDFIKDHATVRLEPVKDEL